MRCFCTIHLWVHERGILHPTEPNDRHTTPTIDFSIPPPKATVAYPLNFLQSLLDTNNIFNFPSTSTLSEWKFCLILTCNDREWTQFVFSNEQVWLSSDIFRCDTMYRTLSQIFSSSTIIRPVDLALQNDLTTNPVNLNKEGTQFKNQIKMEKNNTQAACYLNIWVVQPWSAISIFTEVSSRSFERMKGNTAGLEPVMKAPRQNKSDRRKHLTIWSLIKVFPFSLLCSYHKHPSWFAQRFGPNAL